MNFLLFSFSPFFAVHLGHGIFHPAEVLFLSKSVFWVKKDVSYAHKIEETSEKKAVHQYRGMYQLPSEGLGREDNR